MSPKSSPLERLWQLISLEKKEISAIYFYAILSGLLQLSVPVGVQAIIGFVLGASMVTSIYVLIFVVVIGVLLVGVLQINQMKIIEKIQQNIFVRNAFQFAETIPRIDLRRAENYYLPEKVNRFFDTVNVQKGISKILLDLPTASVQILFGLILLSLYHPIFIVFGLVLILLLWVILSITSRRGLITSLEESNYKYEVVAWIEEIARVIKSFKFSQGSHLNLSKTDQNVLGYLKARTAHFKILLLQYQTLVAFKVAITIMMLTVGTYLLLNQQLNIGEFIAAEIVILSVISAVEKLIVSIDSVYDVVTGLEKLASVTELPIEKPGNLELNSANNGLSIILKDVNFHYLNEKTVLQNINLNFEANSTICISGDESAGKTSLIRIISGNYHSFTGSVLINDLPIDNYKLESLRDKIGIYINQTDIFKGTVLENIGLNRANIIPSDIIELAKNLGLESFIDQLDEGFETKIDSAGKKLPGTLVKKILLLRAFAHEPKLLLLEEPWQGLDDTVKTKLVNYILNKTINCTVLVISNDLDYANKCNYHVNLIKGKIDFIKTNNIN